MKRLLIGIALGLAAASTVQAMDIETFKYHVDAANWILVAQALENMNPIKPAINVLLAKTSANLNREGASDGSYLCNELLRAAVTTGEMDHPEAGKVLKALIKAGKINPTFAINSAIMYVNKHHPTNKHQGARYYYKLQSILNELRNEIPFIGRFTYPEIAVDPGTCQATIKPSVVHVPLFLILATATVIGISTFIYRHMNKQADDADDQVDDTADNIAKEVTA